MARQNTKTPF